MGITLVTGAGGFIGHHLVKRLKAEGAKVRGVDVKPPDFEHSPADEFHLVDLRSPGTASYVLKDVEHVFHLAADMGGIGYITSTLKDVAYNNSMINLQMFEAACQQQVESFFFSSTACVYPIHRQALGHSPALKETEAIPANPEPGYGWEKLYAEQMLEYYKKDCGMQATIGRYHNVYGPLGTYKGGREKAPAAACYKVANADDGDVVEIWGDGSQTRSFMYIDDCIEGTLRLARSNVRVPVNIGSAERVTITQLYQKICNVAGKSLRLRYNPSKPIGVNGRNSDNTLIESTLGWEPSIPLSEGLISTYNWIKAQS